MIPVIAIVSVSVGQIRAQLTSTNRVRPVPFLVAGLLHVVFNIAVIFLVVILGVAGASH